MHLFTAYIEPLTFWLYAHPHWALFITFFISFAESLAVIGSVVPGSITMTAVGILAGSGVMRVDLTYIAAILGAIAGDSGSYFLGYMFSDRLPSIWPFKKYPQWVTYGRDYFERHGSMSVLIGRFVGPMRSIIPVIAGMMHMPQWRFIIANIISAIGWSILYITPGALIGEASSELSAESATRLFVLIIVLLIIIWICSFAIKHLIKRSHQWLQKKLHLIWLYLKEQPRFTHLIQLITPKNENDYSKTAYLCLSFMLCLSIIFVCSTLAVLNIGLHSINVPIYLFLQSLRTKAFDIFFIITELCINPIVLSSIIISGCIYTIYYKDRRTLRYWLSLCLTTSLTIYLFTRTIHVEAPSHLVRHTIAASFPAMNLSFASALIGFLILFINAHRRTGILIIIRGLMLLILFLAGIALIYLGDNWTSTIIASYAIGFCICLIHWIFYRRTAAIYNRSQLPLILFCTLFTASVCITYVLYYKKIFRSHSHHLAQYVISDDIWWNQQTPLLPIYSTNRIGHRSALLNIQYLGSVKNLQQNLLHQGWKQQRDSLLYFLIMRTSGHYSEMEFPLKAELYLNKKPNLVMVYSSTHHKTCLMMRLWRSNYHIHHYPEPIWLGNIHAFPCSNKNASSSKLMNATELLMETLPDFHFKTVGIPKHIIQQVPKPVDPTLLLIKDPLDTMLTPKEGEE